jgi:hypothetical protein
MEPWNFTEAERRQFREAHAEAKRARPPSKPWRVYGARGISVDYRSQRAAYEAVKSITNAGVTARVWHWEDGRWVLFEKIAASGEG